MDHLYFDHNATTPLHSKVIEAMQECMQKDFGNPSSIHMAGRAARNQIENARESLAELLKVNPTELVFTSGGTEANNLAIFGAVASGKLKGKHLVVSAFEHPSVTECFKKLEGEGWEVTYMLPHENGIVSPESVSEALRDNTAFVSVMAANNEVGTIQPIAAIGQLLNERQILFHTDAVQALGKLDKVHPRDWKVDYLSVSAHKINGPKGVGALYLRKGAPMQGLNLGGPQERSFRGGSENVLGIVGFGKAVEIQIHEGVNQRKAVQEIRDAFLNRWTQMNPTTKINGATAFLLPNTINLTFPGCTSDMLVMALDMQGIMVSAGSACASGSVKYSHVLLSMGRSKEEASSSLRFSFGLGNQLSQIETLVQKLSEVIEVLRRAL